MWIGGATVIVLGIRFKWINKILTQNKDEAIKIATQITYLKPDILVPYRNKIHELLLNPTNLPAEKLISQIRTANKIHPVFTKQEENNFIQDVLANDPSFAGSKITVRDENFEQLRDLLNTYYNSRRVGVKKLIEKLIKNSQNNKVCSLELVRFLDTLEDGNLALIKQIFSYIFNGQAILNYKNIRAHFRQVGLYDFDNKIIYNNILFVLENGLNNTVQQSNIIEIEGVRIPELSIQNIELGGVAFDKDSFQMYLQNPQNKAKFLDWYSANKVALLSDKNLTFYTTKHPIPPHINEIVINRFASLTLLGKELYGLLEDELDAVPNEYLQKVCDEYKDMGLVFEMKNF